MSAPVDAARHEGLHALLVGLQGEVFALKADTVREILDMVPVTDVPGAAPFVRGLINVRGRVVPLADLRVMFGMDRPPPDADTRIVVAEVDIDGEPSLVGIVADKVHDVTDLDGTTVEATPKVGMRWPADFIRGIGRRGDDFIIIPDMARIFGTKAGRDPSFITDERTAQ